MCFVVCFYYNAQLSCGFVISIFSWIFCCCCSSPSLSLSLTLPLSLCLSVTLFVCKKLPSVFVCLSVPPFHCPPSNPLHPLCPFVRARLSFKFCDAAAVAAAAVGGGFVSFLADCFAHSPLDSSSTTLSCSPCPAHFQLVLGVRAVQCFFFILFNLFRWFLLWLPSRCFLCVCVCEFVCLCVHVVCACVCTNSSYRVVLCCCCCIDVAAAVAVAVGVRL